MRNPTKEPTILLVCQEDFLRYESFRASGRYDMRSEETRKLTEINYATYRAIIDNYDALSSKWKKE